MMHVLCVCICRNALITIEENLAMRGLLQVFTSCFLQTRAAQRPQVSATFIILSLTAGDFFNEGNKNANKFFHFKRIATAH